MRSLFKIVVIQPTYDIISHNKQLNHKTKQNNFIYYALHNVNMINYKLCCSAKCSINSLVSQLPRESSCQLDIISNNSINMHF